MTDQYEEKIQVTPEAYYMFKYSTNLRFMFGIADVSFKIIDDSEFYNVILSSREKADVDKIKNKYFSNDSDFEFIHSKFDVDETKALFDGKPPNSEFSNFTVEATEILTKYSLSRTYDFIPSDRIENNDFQNSNVLITLVKKENKENLTEQLERFKKKEKQIYAPVAEVDKNSNYYKTFKKYIETGKELSKNVETQNIINLIKSIYTHKNRFKNNEQDIEKNVKEINSDVKEINSDDSNNKVFEYVETKDGPISYIFVCASSGTGKTQLPFSMDIPMIYLVNNKTMVKDSGSSSSQEIYKNFINLSSHFIECVQRDVQILNLMDDNNSINTIANGLSDKIDKNTLFLPGFLCALIKKIHEKRSHNKTSHWLELQLDVSGYLDITRLGIEDCKKTITELFASKNSEDNAEKEQKPVIFLDESQIPADDFERKRFICEYIYVRKLIKKLDLIPVFMGTNASLGNFTNSETASSTSRNGGIPYPWCYIVYRLAPTSKKYIEGERSKIIRNTENEDARLFVDNVCRLMYTERPLFCNLAFEYMNDRLNSDANGRFDVFGFFQGMLNFIYSAFENRKLKMNTSNTPEKSRIYNFNNITLMSPEYWKEEIEYSNKEIPNTGTDLSEFVDSSKKLKQSDKEVANGIHNHIAHLYVDDEFSKANNNFNFVSIVISDKLVQLCLIYNFKLRELEPFINFTPHHIFKPFSHETLGELAFINTENLNRLLVRPCTNANNKNIIGMDMCPVISALKDITCLCKKLPNDPVVNAIGWTSLEMISSLSCMIATMCSGFGGCSFEEWLKIFLKNLTKDENIKKFDSCRVSCEYDENDGFFKELLKTRIPFCSPSLKARWNSEFALYMMENGADLGITHGELKNESRDFYIERLSRDDISGVDVISGECKNYSDGIGMSMIGNIIEKLFDKSRINFIITNKFNEPNEKIKHISSDYKRINKNAVLYKIETVKCSDDELKYRLRKLYSACNDKIDTQEMKAFIVIEIKDFN